MEVSSLVAQSYSANKAATAPLAGSSGAVFDVAQSFYDTLQQSEEVAKQAMVSRADPHALVNALAQTELAVQTVVTVRDKVVQAYQDILRMPI